MIARTYLADLVGGSTGPIALVEEASAFRDWLLAVDETARSDDAMAWQARKAKAGWARLGWPRSEGGQPVPSWDLHLLRELEERAAPVAARLRLGLDVVAPTLMDHGSARQCTTYLPAMAKGQAIWTALLAEPGSGFSTGDLETVAKRGDGGWRISGKKIWCRFADIATHGVLLAKTGATVEKPGNLTCFIVDLPAPGVRILPIPLVSGRVDLDEVLLDDVWIPEANRLGEVGEGWDVSYALRSFAPQRLDAYALDAAERLTRGRSCPDAADLAILSVLEAALRRQGQFASVVSIEDFRLNRTVAELLARRLNREVARLRQAGSPIGEDDHFGFSVAECQLENGPAHQFLDVLGAAILGAGR